VDRHTAVNADFVRELLPDNSGLQCAEAEIESDSIAVQLVATGPSAECPRCGEATDHVHGWYRRQLRDLPCCGRRLHLIITARKFRCTNPACSQSIFCERLPDLADAYARTTGPLTESHRAIGFTAGGEPGARLAAHLAMPTSPDTLLRRVKSAPEVGSPTPRYVGVDDWAWKKGQRYGTILIDLERHYVIDILPGRDGVALKEWLHAHPGVEIISRDRWSAFAQAASEAAPQAKQIADRFHLLKNLREAIERLFERRSGIVRKALTANPPTVPPVAEVPAQTDLPTPAVEAKPQSCRQQLRDAKRRQRQERYKRVHQLHTEGHPARRIAAMLGLDRHTVHRYLQISQCPERGGTRPASPHMSRFREMIDARLTAGIVNAADIYRELRAGGCRASYYTIRRYVRRRRIALGIIARRPGLPPRVETPSARRLSFAWLRRAENRDVDEVHQVQALHGIEDIHEPLDLAEQFVAMVRKQLSQPLAEWLARAEHSECSELRGFAKGVRHDEAAVSAAMTESWSNGQVEGQVNRLKAIKRQMFGRAGFKLLRARVREAA
jgi:transposase